MGDFGLDPDCTCDGDPCLCADMEKMMTEAAQMRVISKAAKLTHQAFDIGPGTAFNTGEKLANWYIWGPNGQDMELREEPAMTFGLTRLAVVKLMWCMNETAIQIWGDDWNRGDDE